MLEKKEDKMKNVNQDLIQTDIKNIESVKVLIKNIYIEKTEFLYENKQESFIKTVNEVVKSDTISQVIYSI